MCSKHNEQSLLETKAVRKPLVEGAGVVKTFLTMLLAHLGVCLLCINVLFDLFILGIPAYLISFVSMKYFRKYIEQRFIPKLGVCGGRINGDDD